MKSEKAQKREHLILNKKLAQRSLQSQKSFRKLCKQRFACQQDAEQALSDWESAQRYTSISDKRVICQAVFEKSGRPKVNQQPDSHYYQLAGALYSDLEKKALSEAQKGLFILASNDCSDKLTMEKMLEIYKSQQSVEKGFRFLKSPDFLTSALYLKKPERIEALLMIMTCCLMVYAALEHKIRRQLKTCSRYFPDLKYKPTQHPTARWVFFCFQGIDELSIAGKQALILNLQERNQTILDCLGEIYQQIYS